VLHAPLLELAPPPPAQPGIITEPPAVSQPFPWSFRHALHPTTRPHQLDGPTT
jgi:hypothetical protein